MCDSYSYNSQPTHTNTSQREITIRATALLHTWNDVIVRCHCWEWETEASIKRLDTYTRHHTQAHTSVTLTFVRSVAGVVSMTLLFIVCAFYISCMYYMRVETTIATMNKINWERKEAKKCVLNESEKTIQICVFVKKSIWANEGVCIHTVAIHWHIATHLHRLTHTDTHTHAMTGKKIIYTNAREMKKSCAWKW